VWAKEVEERGAGEIRLTSVDRDGTGSGYNDEMNETIRSKVAIPIIASGGAGNVDDIINATKFADALSFSSITHYKLVETLMDSDFDFGQP
jgi:imidazole glycerol-phosphate synthase subunit HisF